MPDLLTHADLLRLDRAISLSPAELRKESPELLEKIRETEAARAKEAVVERFADAPVELRKAVEELEVKPGAGEDIKVELIAALKERGVREADVAEAEDRLATLATGEALAEDIPIAANPQLTGDLAKARLHRLISISEVADAKAETVTAHGLTDTTIDDATLEGLVEVGELTQKDAKELGATVGLYRLLEEDPALTEHVKGLDIAAAPGGKVTEPRDLVHLTHDDWTKALSADGVDVREGLTKDQRATVLAKRVALAFPTDAILARSAPLDAKALTAAVKKAKPALDEGGALTGAADLSGKPKAVRDAAEEARRLVDSHPGLGLGEVLEDKKLSVPARVKKVGERIAAVTKLVDANPDVELLGLDLSVGSEDVAALRYTGIPASDQPYVLNNVKSQQRLLSIVGDPHDVPIVAAAGYGAGIAMVKDGRAEFTRKTGLKPEVANRYFDEALTAISSTSSATISIIDAIRGGFGPLGVGNLSPGIENYFREIDGWEDLFGSQDYCQCEHCSSILSPAAYFVDLMEFVEEHLTSKVFTGSKASHVLALKVRRPDLWTLPLTCENTNTEIPLLVIVNEILENYIATRAGYTGDLSDRAEVWRRVYRDRLQDAVDSFSQPFMLPLARLESYLAHFDRSRAEIARAVGKSADVVAAAALGLSVRERDLITTANETQAFLRRVYALNFTFPTASTVDPVDAQDLLTAIDVTRDELGDLVGGRFVQAGTSQAIEIRSERRDAESVQNDVERVRGLRPSSLDRLHRFTRLWRKTGWTPRELDLTLTHLGNAGLATGIDAAALRGIVRVRDLAKRFKLDVEETTALYDVLPTTSVADGKPALFDRLFNLPDFVQLDGTFPKNTTKFVHPALRDNPAAPSNNHTLQRLLAGLRVDADRLHQLILGLAQPLGVNPASTSEPARGFNLTVANLSLLYRHARLAQWLRLSVPDLFRTIDLAPGIAGAHVASLDELHALLEFGDWTKGSKLKLDDVAYAIGQPVADATRYPTAAEVAQRVVDRVAADNPLTFGENIFTFVDGVGEAESRAILTANPTAVVHNADGSYRLADGFDPGAALTLPAGVTAPEPDLRALLTARHPSQIVPTYLASELSVEVPKAIALVALAGSDLLDPDLAIALRGEGPLTPLEDIATVVMRLAVLLQGDAFDADAIDFVRTHTAVFGLTDVTAPTLDAMRKLDVYRQLGDEDEQRGEDLRELFGAFAPATGFSTADEAALARVLEVEVAVASSLQAHMTLPGTAPEALLTLLRAAALAAFIGIDGGTLADIADTGYDALDSAANAVLAAFRAKYPDEKKWNEQIEPFEARILNRRRDGLADYLVHTVKPQFATRADLYRYFLVDVDVDGCFKTSRVVAATGSLQLYVHRTLMNLEQDQAGNVHVQPSMVPLEEWDWRKHYRVWEANRKVFLWSENYLFPDLRDDKTPLFEELEGALLQTELDEQSVLDAYSAYLEGFQEVSNLKIAGAYHDIDGASQSDVLHLFGVTAGDPPNYFYRRVENARYGETSDSKGVVWGPWVPMDVKIPVRRVAPVVHNGRLQVFWIEIVTTPQNSVSDASSSFVGYAHKLSLKYSTLRLDGRWTPPQKVSLYGPHPFTESDGIIDDPLAEPEEWTDFWGAIGGLAGFGIFGNPSGGADLPSAMQKLITPRYDTQMHTKARDGYTLTGLEWEQVYPEVEGTSLAIHGAGYQMHAYVDLFRKTTRNAPGWIPTGIYCTNNYSPPSPTLGMKWGTLWSGSRAYTSWRDYAYAALIADATRYDRVLKNWSPASRQSSSTGVWATPVAEIGSGEYMPINGSLSDGILDVRGDIYLLQSSVRDGARWLLKRLGTTLAETVSRALFTRGVDGLLDYETQRVLAEAPRNFGIVANKIEDKVVTGRIEYTGSYGVYYREIFFHIPFLIAQALNSQGKYAEAQRWYQYIFNPTSSEIVNDIPSLSAAENAARKRDRNWRYREFRGLDLPTLRSILTDAKAIEAYKTDPFNPHAIARLRLSAYQKAIVMRYIDNLLDWADELFTQFQMETVNQAMMLYATAADILGERPAVLGECGEGVISPKTYEAIKPFLGKGTEFLTELEHWTHVKHQREYIGKKKRKKLAVDVSDAASASDAVFGLAQVKAAGVVSKEEARKVMLREAQPDDLTDASRVVKERLKSTDGMAIGSSEEAVTVKRATASTSSAAVVAGTVGGGGVAGTTYEGVDVKANADLFATDLTNTVKWKDMVKSGRESRYEPAAKHKLRDLVVKEKNVHPYFGWALVRQVSPAFCVPQNKDLVAYWDRLEDRLYKLRNCMDITGARRKLSLFAPEIDPMMLVRARAAGLSLDDVLDAIGGELPPYRFTYLLEKAKTFSSTVQSFGSALLGALERKDGEELNELRVVHQQQLLALTTDVRHWEYNTAVAAVEALEKRRESIEHRRAYYAGLVNGGLNAEEWTQRISRHLATVLHGTEATLGFLSGALHLIPQLGSPFAMKYGGMEVGSASHRFAVGVRALADLADVVSASAGLEAGFSRRDQGWRRDLEAAQDDLAEIDKQIEGAMLRREIAERAIEQHEKTLEQTDEIYQMYKDRFTGVGLYSWLATETQRLYREAYNATYALARLAERAYRFERDDDATVSLQANYWDASKAGLRAGERLLIDLQRLERRYLETNYRTHEVDQSFSLLQLDPAALVELRETGRCEFDIPEMAFDMFYPGHYRRRIRSVRLTIPSITGPYTNVSATLRMLESHVRREPQLGPDELVQVPLPRTSTIATSTAQNDGGVFEMTFRDERYMPFEGAGAVSRWQLELPANFRQFDYQTINDVILSMAYTAQEDGVLRTTVEGLNANIEGALLNVLENQPLGRLFSLRQDFSSAFSRLLHSPEGTAVAIEITDRHFPAFLTGRDLDVASATLVVRTADGASVGGLKIKLNGANQSGFAADATLGDLPAKSVGTALSTGIVGEHTIEIDDAGDLAPDSPEPGDDSALDETKVADIMLYVETQVA